MSTEGPYIYIRFTFQSLEISCHFIAPACWMPLERFGKDGCATAKTVCLWNSALRGANSNDETWSGSETSTRLSVCPSGRLKKAEDKKFQIKYSGRASVTWVRQRAESFIQFTLVQTNGSAFLFYISSEKCQLWFQCAPSGSCSLLNCIETISSPQEQLEAMRLWLYLISFGLDSRKDP